MNSHSFETMKRVYEEACAITPGDYGGISETKYCSDYGPDPGDWRIGPFQQEDSLTFRKTRPFSDPTGIGWESHFIFNPCLVEKDGKLYLFYRAAPQKESLSSRIGLAVYEEGKGWEDLSGDPVIYPTEEDETHGTEDPKIYRYNGRYYLFYQANWVPDEQRRLEILDGTDPVWNLCTVTKLAMSDDLVHWEKKGIAVPYSVSKGWSKGAVIPRNPSGDPVRIGGKFLMFVSEGCGGRQAVGFSEDLEHWEFEYREFLPFPRELGHLCEVACCTVCYEESGLDMLMDYFYQQPDGAFQAGQAHYQISDPYHPLELKKGGCLAWGGLLCRNGRWLVAQGWDAPKGEQILYFYSSDKSHKGGDPLGT